MLSTKLIFSKRVWEKFCLKHLQANFLQSWYWGVCNKLLGFKIFRIGLYLNNKLIGICLVIKKEAKRGSFLEVPAGPLLNFENPEYFKYILKRLKKIGLKEKCCFVRIRQQII